jgi:hexosaminidase
VIRRFAALAVLALLIPASAEAANPRPKTIPALRVWKGASEGSYRLRKSIRVVVPRRYYRRLRSTARVLAVDLRRLTGRRVRVRRLFGRRKLRRGDIHLLLRARDRRLGREGYRLRSARSLDIRARTATGVFYGTRTLLQLLRQSYAIPRGRALDWPRYPQRGLMIDLGRRIYPQRWIESHIRELAYLKLNLLHLHLTDDQRWGIESSSHPEVVSSQALTKRQLRQILAVARRYHVTVVPEIDMPAHFGSVFEAHPDFELRTAAGIVPPQGPDSRKLDITNPAALRFVRDLLEEYLPLFPGPWWHVGADEVLMEAQYPLYPRLAAYARSRYGPRAGTKDAILGFVNWVDGIVRRHGKTTRAWHDELSNGAVLRANRQILVEWWVNISPLSDPQPPTPFELLARGHRIMNAGWYPTYFTGDIGPINGQPDMRRAYESWRVHQFYGPDGGDDHFQFPPFVISPADRRNVGSKINAWDNRNLPLREITDGLEPRLRVMAQKTWESPVLTGSYPAFQRVESALGHAPGYSPSG